MGDIREEFSEITREEALKLNGLSVEVNHNPKPNPDPNPN